MLRKSVGFLGAIFMLSAGWAWAQSAEYLTLGKNTFAFHEELFRQNQIKLEPIAVVDAEIFIELIGIPNAAKINELRIQLRRSLGLNNANAVFANNFRTIVYDLDWARKSPHLFYLVMGHEAGHHFCGHTIGKAHSSSFETELEADRFAGASVKRFEAYHNRSFFDQVMAAAARHYPEAGSASYPSRAQRLAAIRKGYEEGSPCGNLAPVTQQGFSRGVR